MTIYLTELVVYAILCIGWNEIRVAAHTPAHSVDDSVNRAGPHSYLFSSRLPIPAHARKATRTTRPGGVKHRGLNLILYRNRR